MLDAGHDGSDCVGSFDSEPDRPSRRQYTIKGIDAQTVALMRDAARSEGMKINSWVSMRMKQAAERALRSTASVVETEAHPNVGDSPDVRLTSAPDADIGKLISLWTERFTRIESEMYELTKAQRVIMTKLLSDR